MRTLPALASFVLVFTASAHADPVHDALQDYALYQNDVSTLLDVEISSGDVADAALARMQRHNPANVARGWIAYGALTAAQSPAFAQSIENSVRGGSRADVLRQLREDITFARRQQGGGDQAVHLILDAASADGGRASTAGDRFDQYARNAVGVQLASTGRRANLGDVLLSPEMQQRLHVGPASAQPVSDVNSFGGRRFWDSVAGRSARISGDGAGREQASYASVTDHMLTLAAIIAADATDSESARVNDLLDEPLTHQCMYMQQLQLRQCLSVSHDASDRAYCMGHHALEGPGACFANVAH